MLQFFLVSSGLFLFSVYYIVVTPVLHRDGLIFQEIALLISLGLTLVAIVFRFLEWPKPWCRRTVCSLMTVSLIVAFLSLLLDSVTGPVGTIGFESPGLALATFASGLFSASAALIVLHSREIFFTVAAMQSAYTTVVVGLSLCV